jgi:hypothetical protein
MSGIYQNFKRWKLPTKLAALAAIVSVAFNLFSFGKWAVDTIGQKYFHHPLTENLEIVTAAVTSHYCLGKFESGLVWKTKVPPFPKDFSDMGEMTWFGFRRPVCLRLVNKGDKSISVNHVRIGLTASDFQNAEDIWLYFSDPTFTDSGSFPLYLEPGRERVVGIFMTWPISDSIKSRIQPIADRKLTDARTIYNAYLAPTHNLVMTSDEGFQILLAELLANDIRRYFCVKPVDSVKIITDVIVSSGEFKRSQLSF